jgi:hypothetical protein
VLAPLLAGQPEPPFAKSFVEDRVLGFWDQKLEPGS